MKGGFKSLAFVVAAMGMFGSQGASSFIPGNNSNSVRIKDAVKGASSTQVTSESRKGFNGANPYKYCRTAKENQRQKRKWLRQCPWIRYSNQNPLR